MGNAVSTVVRVEAALWGTCLAPPRPAMSCQDSDGLMSSTSESTASRNLASSAVSFRLSGPDLCREMTVVCLSRLADGCCWDCCRDCLCKRWGGRLPLDLVMMPLVVGDVLGVGDSRARNLRFYGRTVSLCFESMQQTQLVLEAPALAEVNVPS